MKNHLLLLALTLVCYSCPKTIDWEEVHFQPTIITGQFVDHQNYPSTQKVRAEGPVYWSGDLAADSIADDGTFRLAFDLYAPVEIALKPFIHTYIYVEPGDSLHLVINVDDGAGVKFAGDKVDFNTALYTFHNDGFVEEWDSQLHVLKSLSLNDALTYLGSFYEMDTIRLNEFIEAEAPSPELTSSLSTYLLNRHFDQLFEHGLERQRADPQAIDPDTEAYFRAVAGQFRSHLQTLRDHPNFKKTMFNYNQYFAFHKLHGPYHKLMTAPEDYQTYHEIVELEEDLALQQALLFNFGEVLLDIGKLDLFTAFWDGLSQGQRAGPDMQTLNELYLSKVPAPEARPAS